MDEINERFLPFCVLSENRGVPYTPDLEAATIFTLVELERSKGGGLILKQPEETIRFIAKLSYPVWVSPWGELVLAFDGLSQNSYTQKYLSVPDVMGFAENLKRGARTRETHQAFLSDHINYFKVPATEKSLVVKGLMTDNHFVNEFNVYRHAAKGAGNEAEETDLITPTLDENLVSHGINDLETLRQTLQEQVDNIYKNIRFLNRTTQKYMKELQNSAREVREEFKLKIQQEEEIVAPKITQLKDEFDFRMNSMAKSYEKRLIPIQQAKARLEKSNENATTKLERYKVEAKDHGDKGNLASEQKWREKASETRKEISEIEKQIKQNTKALKDLEETRSVETIKLRAELETKITETRSNLIDLEAHRDAKILINTQEMEKLETQTKTMCEYASNAAKLLETNISQLEKLGAEKELGMNGNVLYCIPFYVACYKTDAKKRFMVIPPSVVNNVGVFTKIRGALRISKITHLLTPRFKAISTLAQNVQAIAEKNAAFEAELANLGAINNIFVPGKLSDTIKAGLRGLKDEGWLSEKEVDTLLQRVS